MIKNALKRMFFSVLLAAELAVLADLAAAFFGSRLPFPAFLACLGLLLLLFLLVRKWEMRALRFWALTILVLLLVLALAAGGFLYGFSRAGKYADADHGKQAAFAGHKVLVVVPHEDDELNVAGGIFEQYLDYGSEVYTLFVTNGDYGWNGEQRLTEALAVAERLGLPEDHVLFLGYGDTWDHETHLYNIADPDQRIASNCGRMETYGLPGHPAWNDGNWYTRNNLLADLQDVIETLEPDVILCNDYDPHQDHRAVSLFFEETMGRILRQREDYRPLVLKSLAYANAYFAPPDFYAENIRSVPNPGLAEHDAGIYHWEERLRLPVHSDTLSRSILSSSTYWQLREHASQGAVMMAESVISGDKVFFRRRTDSLSYRAEISASSGDAWKLNDFKLLDTEDVRGSSLTGAGTWVPETGDGDREITVKLDKPAALTELRFYDNPDPEQNVLDLLIRFDDGREVHSGPLDPLGAATAVALDGTVTEGFTVRINGQRGRDAGLTELECYRGDAPDGLDFIKLMNRNEDFVYDYYVDRSGRERFFLYLSGDAPEWSAENYSVRTDNPACRVQMTEEGIEVLCPKGERCLLTVSSADGRLSDTVKLSNPGRFLRTSAQSLEQALRRIWEQVLPNCNAFVLVRDVYRLARYGTTHAANGSQ